MSTPRFDKLFEDYMKNESSGDKSKTEKIAIARKHMKRAKATGNGGWQKMLKKRIAKYQAEDVEEIELEENLAGDGGVFGDTGAPDLSQNTDSYATGDARLPKALGSVQRRIGTSKVRKKKKKKDD